MQVCAGQASHADALLRARTEITNTNPTVRPGQSSGRALPNGAAINGRKTSDLGQPPDATWRFIDSMSVSASRPRAPKARRETVARGGPR